MSENDFSSGLSAIASKSISFFTGLGLRLLVHFSSLVAAAIASASLSVPDGLPWTGSAAVVITAYIGLICLIPKGIGLNAAWLVPTGLGVFQCLFWSFWGVPWQLTLLWGGILTWLIRLLARKGDLGWEWSVAPWLLIAIYGFFNDLGFLTPVSIPFWTFALLAPAGWMGLALHARRNYEPLHRSKLASARDRMAGLLSACALPDPLNKQVKLLVDQSREFGRGLPGMDAASAALIADIDAAADKLARYSGPSGVWSDDADRLAAEAEKLNARLGERLREFSARKAPPDNALAARIEEFHKKILSLAAKKQLLPPDMRTRIDGIAEAAENILACMRADPTDVAPADKFLSRYLTAAHTVVDEYARLAGQGSMHDAVAKALARSGELLERLEKAFVDEHGRLLQNDTINFTAELNVLDKLLKMEGR